VPVPPSKISLPSPIIVSLPPSPLSVSTPRPPVSVSSPRPPVIVLTLLSPVRSSLKSEPFKFSIEIMVSLPSPVAVPARRSAVIPIVANEKSQVSEPFPPLIVSSPAPPTIKSSPSPAIRVFAPASPVRVSSRSVPMTFSILRSVSLPWPVALSVTRFTITPEVVDAE
jgi:hypothetical protein